MSKRTLILRDDNIKRRGKQAVDEAPFGYHLILKPPTRSLDQNAKLHALFGEAAKKATFHGRKLTATQWKVIFISGHAMATNQGADIVAGIEGEFVNIRESSAQMSIERMTSLIEYINAWLADNEVSK